MQSIIVVASLVSELAGGGGGGGQNVLNVTKNTLKFKSMMSYNRHFDVATTKKVESLD